MSEKKPTTKTKIIIFILITIANILLARYAAISTSTTQGIVTFYFAVAFMIAFTLWFGAWGVAATYIGCIIGSGIAAGFPLEVNLYWSLADVWQVLIPLTAFQILKATPAIKTKKDIGVFLVFGWLINNLAGAIWGATTLVAGGQFASAEFTNLFGNWFFGNLAVTILITPLLLRFITPTLKKKGLLIKNY